MIKQLKKTIFKFNKKVKKKEGKVYFVAKHSCNPTKVELVFLKNNKKGKWSGKKELIDFIEKEKLY